MTIWVIKKKGEKFILEDNLADVYSDKNDAMQQHLDMDGYVIEELDCPFIYTMD
jgi:hypothetical protein